VNRLELPYGSWPTPITSELIVRSARLPNAVQVDGDQVWWSEGRPEEGGRTAVLRLGPDGEQVEVLAAPWNARSGVHEYGGGAWWVRGGVLWFVDWPSQRLHRLAPGGEPEPLTREPKVPRGLRYADGDVHPNGRTMLCVQEEHRVDGDVVNTIVRLDALVPSPMPDIVVKGPDFVADPRWRPDGGAFCWLEWDHPDMPWDAVRLVVDEGGSRTVVAGADRRESICQPTWGTDGSLWFSTDRSGFWSLHRWTPSGGVEAMVDVQQDIGFPQWAFGQSCFALLDDGRVAFVLRDAGLDQLAVREVDGAVTTVEHDVTSIDQIRPHGSDVVAIVASGATEPEIARIDLDGLIETLVPPRDLGLPSGWFPELQVLDFATGAGDAQAHALFYPPTSLDAVGPRDERPPLIVLIHGGPTGAARPMLQLSRAYWTSRGFAVVDVNYRGSTGYGRAYRDLLQGQWGIADVEDCAAVVAALADLDLVDPDRCCIRGGSAGGFTALAALAFHDVFAAGASHYGVADLGVLAEETHKFEARYLDGLVGPWPADRAVYEARSPIHHLEGIDAPLAVFQGLEDAVVPPNQAEMMVEGLRARGVSVAYVAFDGEGHGFRQAANIRAALDGELSFYAQVLGFELPAAEGIEPIEIS
jgi:dipeptidyl aminopeptidase/acylaminoacyl peptidase